MREKNRYIAFQIVSKKPVSSIEAKKSVWSSSMGFLGELDLSGSGLMFVDNCFDEKKQKGIIKVKRNYKDKIIMALALIKNVNGEEVIFSPLGVSGIIDKAKSRYIEA